MIFHRCFAWDRNTSTAAEGGALWFARAYQGDGRHDNPDAYGCLYLAEQAVSAVVEQLARFRGSMLVPQVLVRRGLPLALATIVAVPRPAGPGSTFLGFGVPSGNRHGAVAFTADPTNGGPTDAVVWDP